MLHLLMLMLLLQVLWFLAAVDNGLNTSGRSSAALIATVTYFDLTPTIDVDAVDAVDTHSVVSALADCCC